MKIKIPHIGYTVTIQDIKTAKGEARDFLSKGYLACAHRVDLNNSTIYVTLPIKVKDHATLGHEIIHVLQHICDSRGIEFIHEQEHIAYIYQYIFNEATGYKYDFDSSLSKR